MGAIVCAWIRWRYGKVYALRPPLGWRHHATLNHRTRWLFANLLWRAECRLFDRYGAEMRERWLSSMNPKANA